MKYKVFIDGQEGTTGLQLQKRLSNHADVELLLIDESLRKDNAERKRLINSADAVFLCLPDEAAKEALSMVESKSVVVIDASTAHRVSPGWDYGFPELSKSHRANIAKSKRVANPGCYATGFIVSVYPLVTSGIVGKSYPFTCHGISGYSGGGKKMIADYESPNRPYRYDSPRQYGLTLAHKHLPEMQHVTGIAQKPIFNPIVCDFFSGMAVSVPLYTRLLTKQMKRQDLQDFYAEYYANQPLMSVCGMEGDGFLAANEIRDTSNLRLHVIGNDEMVTLVAVFDNLGKGASGAAVQNMNIALGLLETTSIDGGLNDENV